MSLIYYKKLIKIYKIFKNKKGVNKTSYNSTVLIGDKNGGVGLGRSSNFNQNISIFKAVSKAKFNFFKIFLTNGTIPHPIVGKSGKCVINIYPSKNICNFSCGSYVRIIFDIMGIYNISSKIYGSNNFYNILKATFNALLNLKSILFISRKKCF